jgi:hypothetical protein
MTTCGAPPECPKQLEGELARVRHRKTPVTIRRAAADDERILSFVARDADATMMERLGTPLKVRQECLGHRDPRITQMIYTHVASEDSRKVAAQFGEAVWGILDLNGRKKENGSGVEPPKPFVIT